jgi:S-adenosylmethionine hydrolase
LRSSCLKAGEKVTGLDDPSDIQGDDFRKLGYTLGEKVPVRVGNRQFVMPYVKTFMDVPVGELLLYIDSRGRVGLARNERDFSRTYKVAPPVPIFIPRKGK